MAQKNKTPTNEERPNRHRNITAVALATSWRFCLKPVGSGLFDAINDSLSETTSIKSSFPTTQVKPLDVVPTHANTHIFPLKKKYKNQLLPESPRSRGWNWRRCPECWVGLRAWAWRTSSSWAWEFDLRSEAKASRTDLTNKNGLRCLWNCWQMNFQQRCRFEIYVSTILLNQFQMNFQPTNISQLKHTNSHHPSRGWTGTACTACTACTVCTGITGSGWASWGHVGWAELRVYWTWSQLILEMNISKVYSIPKNMLSNVFHPISQLHPVQQVAESVSAGLLIIWHGIYPVVIPWPPGQHFNWEIQTYTKTNLRNGIDDEHIMIKYSAYETFQNPSLLGLDHRVWELSKLPWNIQCSLWRADGRFTARRILWGKPFELM